MMWLVQIELDNRSAETTGDIDDFGSHTYILYIDGERKEAKNTRIEFLADGNATLDSIEKRVKGTKGIKNLSVKRWEW